MHESLQPAQGHGSDSSSQPASTASRCKPQYSFPASTLRQGHSTRRHRKLETAVTRLAVKGSELWSALVSTHQKLPGKLVTKCTSCPCTTARSSALLSWRNSRQTSCNSWQVRENSSAA